MWRVQRPPTRGLCEGDRVSVRRIPGSIAQHLRSPLTPAPRTVCACKHSATDASATCATCAAAVTGRATTALSERRAAVAQRAVSCRHTVSVEPSPPPTARHMHRSSSMDAGDASAMLAPPPPPGERPAPHSASGELPSHSGRPAAITWRAVSCRCTAGSGPPSHSERRAVLAPWPSPTARHVHGGSIVGASGTASGELPLSRRHPQRPCVREQRHGCERHQCRTCAAAVGGGAAATLSERQAAFAQQAASCHPTASCQRTVAVTHSAPRAQEQQHGCKRRQRHTCAAALTGRAATRCTS